MGKAPKRIEMNLIAAPLTEEKTLLLRVPLVRSDDDDGADIDVSRISARVESPRISRPVNLISTI